MKNQRAIWLLLLANGISGVAQGISMLAVPWYFTGIIHSESLYGKVFLVTTFISMFWGLYAGTLIDRYDRKKIFLVLNLSGFVLLSAVTVWGFIAGQLPWQGVAAVFATTMFVYNIHYPNLYAFAQEITPKANYSRVTSLLEIQGQLAFTTAGACAAILLKGINGQLNFFGVEIPLPFHFSAWPVHEIFAINAITYLIAAFIISRIHSLSLVNTPHDLSSLTERLKTGVRFLKNHPLIFHFGNASLLVFLTIMVFNMYVMPIYVNGYLHQNGDVFAFGDMAFSFGALLAGFLTTKLFTDKTTVKGIIILSGVTGLMYAAMAGSKILFVFFFAQFIIGACNAAVRIMRVTYMFHHIPNRVIGRTGSIFFVVNVVLRMVLVGFFSLSFFHEANNILWAVLVLAVTCFAAVAVLAYNYRRLKNMPEVQA